MILFIIQIYYFFVDFFILGLFAHYGYSLGFGIVILGILLIHGIIFITILELYKGMAHREPWTRKFTIFYLIWASLWAFWGLLVGNNIIVHVLLLIIYIAMIFYLTTPMAQWYFKKIYRYGKYILYTKLVTLRSGINLPIYFFSWKTPKSGHPTTLPEGYTVKENENSHMPYLKKVNPEIKQKKQTESMNMKTESSTDIIYVVINGHDKHHDKPWVIKGNDTIYKYSHTKQEAIQTARKIAQKLKARVLVQNMNGKFSYGFTPKPKNIIQ
jgi:hypothetical protein